MFEYLKNNTYPGRGVMIGQTPNGKNAVLAYFIMGRSENSRNRVFVASQGGIKTEAYDPSKLSDPSLIIYAPVRVIGDSTIVTNGDQTDTIYDFMKEGKTFKEALRTREFEPDAPNYTPRISGLYTKKEGSFSYELSILKSGITPDVCERQFFEYEKPIAGKAHIIHTYKKDGNPIVSFQGEPAIIDTNDDINSFTDELWNSLNEENRVSLFVRYIDLETGKEETKIINKNK